MVVKKCEKQLSAQFESHTGRHKMYTFKISNEKSKSVILRSPRKSKECRFSRCTRFQHRWDA